MARTDSAILHEIVRIIQERATVPEKVRIRTKQYQITYLEDHRQRLEEAMRRHDSDRLGMLFGQLPGRIKYQMLKASKNGKSGAKANAKQMAKAKQVRKVLAKPAPRPASKPAPRLASKPAPRSASKPATKVRPKAMAKPKPKPKPKTAARAGGKSRARA